MNLSAIKRQFSTCFFILNRTFSSLIVIVLYSGSTGCDQSARLRELGETDPKIKISWSKGRIKSLSVHGDKSLQRLLPLTEGSIPIDRMFLQYCNLQTNEFKLLSKIRTLKNLEIAGGSIHEQKNLEELRQLPDLRTLHLRACKLDNEVFKSLDGLMNVSDLDLDGNQISSITGLTKINLPKLLHFAVASNPINDEGFKDIVLLPKLEHIHILDTQISVEGCKLASALFMLRSFSMPNMPIAKQREVKAAFDEARRDAQLKGIAVLPEKEYPFAYLESGFFKNRRE